MSYQPKAGQIYESVQSGSARLAKVAGNCTGIFMHIHKCAGTSLIKAVQQTDNVLCVVARQGSFEGRTGTDLINPQVWASAFKFTFVRNPFARVLSAYRMFARSQHFSAMFPNFHAFVSFLQWCDLENHVAYSDEAELPDGTGYTGLMDNRIHHLSCFTNPKYHLSEMDFVGKVEQFEADLAFVEKQVNATIPLLHERKQSPVRYQDYYTADLRRMVERKFAKDLDLFGYTF